MNEKLFHNMEFDLFLRCLNEAREAIDETEILFLDDLERGECIMGYIPYITMDGRIQRFAAPYWIGTGCDIKDGMEFLTAEDLLNAKVYGGRSISQAWDQVCVLHFGYVPLDIWFNACPFRDDIILKNGIWKLSSSGRESKPNDI